MSDLNTLKTLVWRLGVVLLAFFKSLFLFSGSVWHSQNTLLLENTILQTLTRTVRTLRSPRETLRPWKEYFTGKVLSEYCGLTPCWAVRLTSPNSKKEIRKCGGSTAPKDIPRASSTCQSWFKIFKITSTSDYYSTSPSDSCSSSHRQVIFNVKLAHVVGCLI